MISGFATPDGTTCFASRFPDQQQAGHFRHAPHVPVVRDLLLSSIGVGTYLGDPTDEADDAYTEAIATAVRNGINVIDTAINYRHQRSERNVGAAIKSLLDNKEAARDELLVCTKAGYIPFDTNMPQDAVSYLRREYIETGVAPAAEIVGGSHCMAPSYLSNQLERSRLNTNLETIDVFYIHNPETQLGYVPRDEFHKRLRTTFEFLENAVANSKIRYYGAATWGGFRANPADRAYLSLEDFITNAKKVAGENHHFRFVQLPFNLAMLEAYAYGNQYREQQPASLLMQAQAFGVAVVGSGTLYQGNLTQGLPEQLKSALNANSDAEAAIQFARSATNLTTSLIGMGQKQHAEANAVIGKKPLVAREAWESLFSKK